MTHAPDHPHGHDHAHDHGHDEPNAEPLGHYETMQIALTELLIEQGLFGADDVRREVEAMHARGPDRGAAVVARAWTDPAFKARLLVDGTAACEALDIAMGPTKLVVVENTPGLHNVIVCTLCSCYPRMLLGLPPDWYKSRPYRSRVVCEPRAVLDEFGLTLPAKTVVRVHDSTADLRYMVLPERPAGTDGLSENALAALVTRDCMIGVALPKVP